MHTHVYLLTGWKFVSLFFWFPVSYTIDSEIIPVPVVSFISTKRDTGLTPLVVGLGLLTRIGTGLARLRLSISQFQKLSTALKEALITLPYRFLQSKIRSTC
jgi:hypothetical protein